MKLTRKTIAAILAGTLLAGSGAALSFGGPGMGGCNMGGGPMGAVYQLNDLTDEQRDKLLQLQKERRGQMRALGDAMRDIRRQLMDAMDDGADDKTVQALAEKAGDQMTARILARAEAKKKVDAILTDKQRKELQSYGAGGFGAGCGRGSGRGGYGQGWGQGFGPGGQGPGMGRGFGW